MVAEIRFLDEHVGQDPGDVLVLELEVETLTVRQLINMREG